MSQGIIYLIVNKQNGEKYISQTTQLMNKQWQEHIQESMRMSDLPLHRAMRKYGNHNFMIKEIDQCNADLLKEKEQYWISKYNPEYNNINEKEEVVIEEEKKEVVKTNWGLLTDKNRGNGKHCGIRIQSLNIETGETKEWENSRVAAIELTGNANRASNILISAKKGYIAYNHRWKLLEQKNKKKAVKAVNKVTWEEYYFESCADAIRRVGGNSKGTGLKKALKSKGRYTWKGFIWFYV